MGGKIVSLKEVENRINIFRTLVIDMAKSKGFSYPNTLKDSQELHSLLDEVISLKEKEVASLKELENRINIFRTLVIDMAKSKGFAHPDTIKYSHELDSLLNEYQETKVKR